MIVEIFKSSLQLITNHNLDYRKFEKQYILEDKIQYEITVGRNYVIISQSSEPVTGEANYTVLYTLSLDKVDMNYVKVVTYEQLHQFVNDNYKGDIYITIPFNSDDYNTFFVENYDETYSEKLSTNFTKEELEAEIFQLGTTKSDPLFTFGCESYINNKDSFMECIKYNSEKNIINGYFAIALRENKDIIPILENLISLATKDMNDVKHNNSMHS